MELPSLKIDVSQTPILSTTGSSSYNTYSQTLRLRYGLEPVPYSWLIMERIEGNHIGDAQARMTEINMDRIQVEMGQHVGLLHAHTREAGFGPLVGEASDTWPEHFQRQIASEMRDAWATGLMRDGDRAACERIVESIPDQLKRDVKPSLVHGDIWATNIMIGGGLGEMGISGFLDPGGIFADPEYELAYLEIWHTVTPHFFEAYSAHHQITEGYELRRMFYWLNTLLLHVRAFKTDHYASAATDLVRRLGEWV
ncbi:MAG TPA: fructosamine kinase family protein [Armatimonadota bacterium]|nr:fructosamine kinase family protein [Armatimonadota bacterium]